MKIEGCVIFGAYFALIIGLVIGQISCIVKLCSCDFEPSYKAEVIYTIGTFTPLGSVIGYMDFGK
ncbi:MAG: hypothetical protein ABL940_08250 [Bacteroidia bacterium]